ncbi:MAG: prepilin-type N-terminal cleavage/methylation domain-containing protein [bacterium]
MILRRPTGFTLIELIIAAAISVAVLMVAVPRYNGFIRQQEFAGSAQDIVDCIQYAQRTAAAPGTDTDGMKMGFVSVTLTTAPDTATSPVPLNVGPVYCVVDAYKSLDYIGRPPNLAGGQTGSGSLPGPVYVATLRSVTASSSVRLGGATVAVSPNSIDPGQPIRILFGVNEHGLPRIICQPPFPPYNTNRTNFTNAFHGSDCSSKYQGAGFEMKITLVDATTAGTSDPTSGDITIGPLGAPIIFTLNK